MGKVSKAELFKKKKSSKSAPKVKKSVGRQRGIIYVTHEGLRQHAQKLLLNLVDLGGKAHAVCLAVLLKRILLTLDEEQAKELQKTIFVDDKLVKANPQCLEHPKGCICEHAPPTTDELTQLYWAKASARFPS